MDTPLQFWIAFNCVVLALLALDLFVFHRKAHAVSGLEAAIWSGVWVVLSLCFNGLVWHWKGPAQALDFFTGYVIEYSLSVDNIFVFILIFSYFRVKPEHQHRVLFWGILGALIMRGIMIWVGVTLIVMFHWMLYLFGAFLVFTGIKMFVHNDEEEIDPEHNPIVRLCTRWFSVSRVTPGPHFTTVQDGRRMLTPLAIVLVMVESTDLLFALDSIPAILAITQDPFIVYTSNVCAILGLRSLYFLLARAMAQFRYLRIGLAAILTFIGLKMLVADWFHISTPVSLGIVAFCLLLAVLASILRPQAAPELPPN
jgi:tellurite resistance protein TerC